MPNSKSVQIERNLNAIEAIQTGIESIDVALEAIQVSQAAIAGASAASYNVTYIFPIKNWDTLWTEVINTPAGKRARVVAVTLYDVTETFVDTTTDARIDVGDGTDADAFALTAGFGTLAAAASLAPAITQGVTEIIPVGDIVTVTGVPAGTPGNGIATVALTLEFFD